MRVYSDIIPDTGKYVTAAGNTDAVVILTTLPDDYAIVKWVAWSFNWNPSVAWLTVKDTTNNLEYIEIHLDSNLTDKSYDVLNFGPGGINFEVGAQVEVRLHATGSTTPPKSKSLSVSYQ